MKRRTFISGAAGLSLVPHQLATSAADQTPQADAAPAAERPTAVLKFTRAVVDIALVCSDFQESLRFYHELLGLEIVQEVQIPDAVARGAVLAPRGFRQVRLRAGDTLIKLMDIPSPPPPRSERFAAGVRWLTFFVEDVQQTFEQLKAKGVRFLSAPVAPPDAVGVVCAVDPDGLLLEFVQTKG